MNGSKGIAVWIVAWSLVGAFWLVVTRGFHPTWTLACIVTSSLIGSYAIASYTHQIHLVPNYWQTAKYWKYALTLTATMLGLTAAALAIIRIFYVHVFGPYPVNYWYIDYGIDLFGMIVHLVGGMAASFGWRRLSKIRFAP